MQGLDKQTAYLKARLGPDEKKHPHYFFSLRWLRIALRKTYSPEDNYLLFDVTGWTRLHFAICAHHTEKAKEILEGENLDENSILTEDAHGNTPLNIAGKMYGQAYAQEIFVIAREAKREKLTQERHRLETELQSVSQQKSTSERALALKTEQLESTRKQLEDTMRELQTTSTQLRMVNEQSERFGRENTGLRKENEDLLTLRFPELIRLTDENRRLGLEVIELRLALKPLVPRVDPSLTDQPSRQDGPSCSIMGAPGRR